MKEKITRLEMDLRNEQKTSEQLKSSVKYSKQEVEVFESHLQGFEKTVQVKK